jgi:hypothetical protein
MLEPSIDELLARELRRQHRRPDGRVNYSEALQGSARIIARLFARIADHEQTIDELERAVEWRLRARDLARLN